jgi:hypothetical protein
MIPLEFVVLFLSILITTFNYGFFSVAGFICLITLIGCLFFLYITKKDAYTSPDEQMLSIFLIIIFSLSLFFSDGIYQTVLRPTLVIRYLPVFLFPVIVTYLRPFSTLPKRTRRMRYLSLILSAAVLRVLMLVASPSPIIDVYTMLKEAPAVLLSGHNPYTAMYSSVYQGVIPDYFTYWPAAFLLEIPFVAGFHDPRVLLVLADILCAYLIYSVSEKKQTGELLSLIYLFRPNSLFIIEQTWLASLELILLLAAWYIHSKKKSDLMSGIFFALLTAIKPLYIVLAVFMFIFSKQKPKFIWSFVLSLLVIVLPFVLWDAAAFRHDTIDFFTRTPTQMPSVPVYRSLNANTFYYMLSNQDIPRTVASAVLGILTLCFLFTIHKRRSIQTVVESSILFLFIFYLFNYFSFINYYYMLSGALMYSFAQKRYL